MDIQTILDIFQKILKAIFDFVKKTEGWDAE